MRKKAFGYWVFVAALILVFGGFLLSGLLFAGLSDSPVGYPLLEEASWFSFGLLLVSVSFFVLGYRKQEVERLSLRQIVIPAIILGMIALVVLPLVSNDIYTYFYRARILVKYGANPYFETYDDHLYDEYYSLLNNVWSKHTAVYGPFFWILMAGLTKLASSKVFETVYLTKAVFLGSMYMCGWLTYKITQSKRALYLCLLNPYLYFYGVLDGHSDMLLLVFILGAFYLVLGKTAKAGQIIVSWFLFLLAFLMKIYVLPISIFLLYFVFRKSKKGDWWKVVGVLAVESVLVVAAVYWPFWQGMETLRRYGELARGYEAYVLGAFRVARESVFFGPAKHLLRTLKVGYIGFYLFMAYRLFRMSGKRKKVGNLFLLSGVYYVAFLMIFIGIWNPWYFVIGIGLVVLGIKDKGGLVEKVIWTFSYLGVLYTILL